MSDFDAREPLEQELRALGERLDVPPAPDVTQAVINSLRAGVPRRRGFVIPRWAMVTAAAVVVVGVLLGATPQGRAAVATILRFAGVEIHVSKSSSPSPPASPLPSATPTSGLPGERTVILDVARKQARFPVRVPAALGDPSEVRIADGGRVVSLLWPGGIRLDQFDGTLDPAYRKEVGAHPEEVSINGVRGLWIPLLHGLSYVPRDGEWRELPSRAAQPTLIWQDGQVGLRLEGIRDRGRAVSVAESLS